ncbi:MAG TPA: CAP domain-containing protein [Actinomycetota bacterium]|jgi:uncharacterized protein YkwD
MTRTRTFLVLAVLLALLAVSTATPASAAGLRAKMFSLINDARTNHGVPKLDLDVRLSQHAKHHSRRMADLNLVYHSAQVENWLSDVDWSIYGENIGKAHTLKRVKELWMASPAHKANVLNEKFDYVGVGVVKQGKWFWVTAIFYG